MLREIGSVFSFLTVLPSPGGTLQTVAGCMYLFPVAGLAIGLLAGSAGLGLSLFLDPLLVGLLVAAALAILTGIHHADGLADFADGLAARGGRDKKLGAMKDLSTGSAGTVGTVLYMIGLVATISLLAGGAGAGFGGGDDDHDRHGLDLLRAILVSEVLAKFSMVLLAAMGSPAAPGSSSPFVEAMRSRKRLAAAFVIMLVPVVLVGGAGAGLLMLGAVMALTVSVLAVSARSFGGITGDVLGATNELARLASLMVYVTV